MDLKFNPERNCTEVFLLDSTNPNANEQDRLDDFLNGSRLDFLIGTGRIVGDCQPPPAQYVLDGEWTVDSLREFISQEGRRNKDAIRRYILGRNQGRSVAGEGYAFEMLDVEIVSPSADYL